ncbi:unnamed protein product, partial [Vitis vinifera]|uniref:Uncharacterized protein n=1 Tax=Vitis vinifera TaxID=29760 RepID=E0CP68_VITVI
MDCVRNVFPKENPIWKREKQRLYRWISSVRRSRLHARRTLIAIQFCSVVFFLFFSVSRQSGMGYAQLEVYLDCGHVQR